MPTRITILHWLTVVLILRVLLRILTNYVDYWPPNFASLFLQGRESIFHGLYRIAFYVHILSAPVVLVNGLLLLNSYLRARAGSVHRYLGRVQVALLLLMVLPSGLVMARHAFAGWPAVLSFVMLSFVTGYCAVLGMFNARRRRFFAHRRWMVRCYVLLCSAVTLRLLSGLGTVLDVANEESAYIVAVWCSWLLPWTILEIILRRSEFTRYAAE